MPRRALAALLIASIFLNVGLILAAVHFAAEAQAKSAAVDTKDKSKDAGDEGFDSVLDRAAAPDARKALKETYHGLEKQIKSASGRSDTNRDYYLIVQSLVIFLGVLATWIVAAGNRNARLAPWAILPTALISGITAAGTLYDFQGTFIRNKEATAKLQELYGEIRLEAFFAEKSPTKICRSKVKEWDARFTDILNRNLDQLLESARKPPQSTN